MEFNYLDYRNKKNLITLKISNKEDYYSDLFQLENSFVSRLDIFQIANTFLAESIQLIINAISLFEKGYLDNAYYSLRQSLETALTIVYLSDFEEQMRKKELNEWRKKSKFPMYSQMIKLLENNKAVFLDVKKNMVCYFESIENTKKYLNKHVHKQGFNTFYVSRSHLLNTDRDYKLTIQEFEKNLISCIGAVVVFRLCLDPFPILLMDEEIYSRTETLMSDAFSMEFITKYIGMDNIENYKKTNIYKEAYDYFITLEKMLPSVLNIKKSSYIDRNNLQEILSQVHLLSETEIQVVVISKVSDKFTRIMLSDFPNTLYFTNIISNRLNFGFSVNDFLKLQKKIDTFNVSLDNIFISSLNIKENKFLVEHNQEFTFEEFEELKINIKNQFNNISKK
ncbi:teicoplanin resistance protein VanZ [Exiguobacterium acetylicum]|uniref:teicoplanin resistance protein VanZ n=1 Tax=Exiguobacterium acetylicum TaxID=41170 RepID=UPI0011EE2DD4|nr:teicoplanin resistance protein VanZ [Exiguobacterium acetylicum]